MLFWNWVGFSAKFLGVCALTTNISREWKIVPSGMFPSLEALLPAGWIQKLSQNLHSSALLIFPLPISCFPQPFLVPPPFVQRFSLLCIFTKIKGNWKVFSWARLRKCRSENEGKPYCERLLEAHDLSSQNWFGFFISSSDKCLVSISLIWINLPRVKGYLKVSVYELFLHNTL